MQTIVEDSLVSDGILEPVQFAMDFPNCASFKSRWTFCQEYGDFKLLNQACKLDNPKIEDLFICVAGGKVGSQSGYQQVSLAEESCKYVVINTHRGLFRYNRMLCHPHRECFNV